MTLRPFARPWLWLGVWAAGWALCIALSLLPPITLDGPPNSDKVGHFLAYFTLSAWATLVFHARRAQALAAVALVLLGLGIEWAQANLTDTRQGDLRDALANTLGVGLGWALAFTPVATLLEKLDRKLFR
ncbi:MAG: VanZ family protein [Arenimonas sp.]|uniref:VanZ family protein n=1 Tax=Arenimonas sp. TaxID=1872635 RepID=UPI0025BE4522|nr:VanZ family protein [Arenimonas sp.]MBW8368036.1 VanZ family protein [Arenimonas sp.]